MSASKTTDWNSPDDAVQFLRGKGWRFDHKWSWLLPRITYRVNEKEDRGNRSHPPAVLRGSHKCGTTFAQI